MLQCVTNSKILRASLEFVSENDYDMIIENEFKTMCTRFGLNESEMITLVTTLDTSLLNAHYYTIWDSLNYYSMDCMDEFKNAYIELLYKSDFKDERIETLCDDLREYIKCNSCINVNHHTRYGVKDGRCILLVDACAKQHYECVKYLLNNPRGHDVENEMVHTNDIDQLDEHCYNTNIIDYMCICNAPLNIIKHLYDLKENNHEYFLSIIRSRFDNTHPKCHIDQACKNGRFDVVKYLFEIQHEDCTKDALYFACMNGHLDIVKYLIDVQHKECVDKYLRYACENNHIDVVKYLFEEKHIDGLTRDDIDKICGISDVNIVKYLLEIQKKDCTTDAIDNACDHGNLDVVKYLFEIQKKDCTNDAMDWACYNGHLDVVKYLFEIQKKNFYYYRDASVKNEDVRNYINQMTNQMTNKIK